MCQGVFLGAGRKPMKRREFIILLGSAAATWPLAARAQQSERRIGVLMSTAADEREGQSRLAAFRDGLQQLGWTDGRNLRIDTRWPASEPDSYRKYAGELVALGTGRYPGLRQRERGG